LRGQVAYWGALGGELHIFIRRPDIFHSELFRGT
jgi:hypothetical protein